MNCSLSVYSILIFLSPPAIMEVDLFRCCSALPLPVFAVPGAAPFFTRSTGRHLGPHRRQRLVKCGVALAPVIPNAIDAFHSGTFSPARWTASAISLIISWSVFSENYSGNSARADLAAAYAKIAACLESTTARLLSPLLLFRKQFVNQRVNFCPAFRGQIGIECREFIVHARHP